MRCHIPHGCHGDSVDAPKLSHREEAVRPTVLFCWAHRLLIHPCRGVSVSLHLHVFPQLLVADCSALAEQYLYLLQDQRVAFNGGGVMRFLVPDVLPDATRLSGARQSAHAKVQLGNLCGEAPVQFKTARSTWRRPFSRILFRHCDFDSNSTYFARHRVLLHKTISGCYLAFSGILLSSASFYCTKHFSCGVSFTCWCTKAWISHQTHLPLLPGESDGPVVAVGVEQAFRFLGAPGTGRVGGGGDVGLE